MSAPLATPTKATKANLTCRQSTMGRKPEPAANLQEAKPLLDRLG